MAREDPQASDDNELEIGLEESEEEISSSESEEESSDSETEMESVVTGLKRSLEDEDETTGGESKRFRVDVGEDFFEKYLVKQMTLFGLTEGLVRERWAILSMETKKELEEEWMVLKAEEMRIERLKAQFVRDLLAAMANVVVP